MDEPFNDANRKQGNFGPYPTYEELRKLQDDGYTAVVSLLHPAVVPFEPKLISDERFRRKRSDQVTQITINRNSDASVG